MKNIKKSVLITLLIVLVSLAPLMAKETLAQTSDGTIVVLNEENKTFEPFIEKTYDCPTGYTIDNINSTNFMGIKWDEGTLTALGNYIKGNYTTGEFFLLELNKNYDNNSIHVDRSYPAPTLKLLDGTEIDGYYESVQAYSSFSNYRNLVGMQQQKTLTYSLRFEVPKGATPVALVFKDVNGQNPTEFELGDEGKI